MFKIMDDGLCAQKNLPTKEAAIEAAEELINSSQFSWVGLYEIVDQEADEVILSFQGGDIDWHEIA